MHLDGYYKLPYLTGEAKAGARDDFYYTNDDGDFVAMRWGDWKAVFCEQRTGGGMQVWADPFTCLRVPKMFNLRMDPYERADLYSDQYYDWLFKNAYMVADAQMKAAAFLETFIEWPPSQLPASFSIDAVAEKVNAHIVETLAKQPAAGADAAAPAKP